MATLPHIGRAKTDGDTESERDRVALAELDAVLPLLAERDCVGEPEPERVAAPREALADCDTDGDGCENRQYCQRSPVSTALHTELRDASSKRSVWPADRSAQQ